MIISKTNRNGPKENAIDAITTAITTLHQQHHVIPVLSINALTAHHPASKHVLIRNEVDQNLITRRGSARRAYEIMYRFEGHSYTLSTAKSEYTIGDLRKDVASKLMMDAMENQLVFNLDGDVVSDLMMNIIAYLVMNDVQTITFDVSLRDIMSRGSVSKAFEILWRFEGHSYTISTSAASYSVEDLRKHVSSKLQLDPKQSQLIFHLDGDVVTNFTMDIIPYFEMNDVRTITFDVVSKGQGPDIVRKGRWSTEFLEEFERSCRAKKLYYMTFPSLVDYAKHIDLKPTAVNSAVQQLTDEVLQETPSGDHQNRDTLLHVLNGLSAESGKKCLFYDSSKNIRPESKSDEISYLNAADDGDTFVLSLDGMDSIVDDEKYEESTTLLEMQCAVMNSTEHPVVEDIRKRLAEVHGVDVKRIIIKDIYAGSTNVVYTVDALTDNEKDRLIKEAAAMEDKMKKMFAEYQRLAIHPALFHNSYDVSMFDARGNKTFTEAQVFQIGPNIAKKSYTQPKGWTRYGLKVLGKYGDDKWLDPFGDDGNWYRSYHGTGMQAGSSIVKGAFMISNNQNGTSAAYGPGVYNSPDISVARGYSKPVTIDTVKGTKRFHFVFMVAVNPATLNTSRTSGAPDNYWIAPTPADIRPYGILIKEI